MRKMRNSNYEDPKVSSVYISDTRERIADSVAEFLELYMSDPGAVWAWHSDEQQG